MAAFSISHHLTQTLCILFSFPFNPNPTQFYGQIHFGNDFSLNWATSHDKLGATSVTSLKTVTVGPGPYLKTVLEVVAKGKLRPAQRCWAAWADTGTGRLGIQPEGQSVWNTTFCISSCYYLLISVPTFWHVAETWSSAAVARALFAGSFGCCHPSHGWPFCPCSYLSLHLSLFCIF